MVKYGPANQPTNDELLLLPLKGQSPVRKAAIQIGSIGRFANEMPAGHPAQ
jgi:hypothetical protein